jgi:hypothetical protein
VKPKFALAVGQSGLVGIVIFPMRETIRWTTPKSPTDLDSIPFVGDKWS